MSVYGSGLYGSGVYGIGGSPEPPVPPYLRHVTTAQLGNSGIVLNGGPDEYGVEWSWQVGSDPWQPGPTPREVSGDRATGSGTWNATRFYEGRSQELQVLVKAPSHEALHRARDRWMAAISLMPFPFVVAEPHATRWAMMRRRGQVPWREETPGGANGGGYATTSASLWADDPLIYGLTLKSASTRFPSSTGGLIWPATWPATWSATVASGHLQLTNDGSWESPIVWRIDGPVVSPVVTDVTSGRSFRLNLELADGEWVTVDSSTWEVLAQGDPQASRRVQFQGSWLDLAPGTHEFAFGGSEAGENAMLTASWRDAGI